MNAIMVGKPDANASVIMAPEADQVKISICPGVSTIIYFRGGSRCFSQRLITCAYRVRKTQELSATGPQPNKIRDCFCSCSNVWSCCTHDFLKINIKEPDCYLGPHITGSGQQTHETPAASDADSVDGREAKLCMTDGSHLRYIHTNWM